MSCFHYEFHRICQKYEGRWKRNCYSHFYPVLEGTLALWNGQRRNRNKVLIEESDIWIWKDTTALFRRNTTDIMLHLIQPRFKNIFGEHYYRLGCYKCLCSCNVMTKCAHRTVISDLQKTPDSMVVHAYILLDPDKDNLYHSYTVWWVLRMVDMIWLLPNRFSSEGHVKFGRWILFPANIHVERAQLVPNRSVM